MHPQQRELEQAPLCTELPKLPGIRELFPEWGTWSNSSSPGLSPRDLPRSREGSFSQTQQSPKQTPFLEVYPPMSRTRSLSSPLFNTSPLLGHESVPPKPVLIPVITTVSPQPMAASNALSVRVASQFRRPRSSPVSPVEQFEARFGNHLHASQTTKMRRYSVGSAHYQQLASTSAERPSSSHSSPGKRSINLPSTGRDRSNSIGSVTSDTSSRPSTASRAPPARYQCSYCPKRFSRPSSLRIHENSHTGAKPFECPEPGCGRHFSVMSNMRRHQKTHRPKSISGYSVASDDYSEGRESPTPTPPSELGIEIPLTPEQNFSPLDTPVEPRSSFDGNQHCYDDIIPHSQ